MEAELKAITRTPVTIPVVPIAATGISAATSATVAFTSAQAGAAAETQAVAAALEKEAVAATKATAAQNAHAASLGRVKQGALSSGLSLFGVRGATLAASSGFLLAAAAVTTFAKSLQSAAQLETSLNVFRVNADATAEEMERVSAAAKALGRDITLPGVTASTAATAMLELARASLSVQDSIEGARGALQLATAAEISVSEATNIVAGSLNSFGLAGTEAVRVADLLAGAAKESQGSIEDLALGLQQVQGTAAEFGVSLDDTVTALTLLTKTGLSARQAGTGLNVALLRLATNDEAKKFVTDLGLRIRDFEGDIRPQVFAELGEAMKGMSKEARQAAVATLFGRDALKAILPLAAAGSDEFNELSEAVTETGLSLEASRARTSGLEGDIENLSNQVSSLGLTFGQVAKGPVSVFVKATADVVAQVNAAAEGSIALVGELKDLADSLPLPRFFDDRGLADIARLGNFLNPLTAQLKLVAKGMEVFGLTTEDTGKKTSVFDNITKSVTGSIAELAKVLRGAAAELRAAQPTDTGLGVLQLQNVVGGFDAQEVRARIAEDNAALLDVLNSEQAFLERQLERGFVTRRPALRRLLEQALLGVVNDINVIQDQAAAEQARLRREREQAAKDLAREQAAQAKALLDLRNSSLDLAIQQAGLTEGTGDDRRAINKAIKVFQKDIVDLEKIKKLTVEQKQKVVDLKSAIAGLRASLQGLEDTQSSGFTIADFFKSAVENFTTFGSNIGGRSAVLSRQDARASAGQSVIAQLGQQQVIEAKTTNQLLTLIYGAISATSRQGRAINSSEALSRLAFDRAKQAADMGF